MDQLCFSVAPSIGVRAMGGEGGAGWSPPATEIM